MDVFASGLTEAAWRRQRSQASNFGRLGLRSLPGRQAAWQRSQASDSRKLLHLVFTKKWKYSKVMTGKHVQNLDSHSQGTKFLTS
jgi:hypothetical protein